MGCDILWDVMRVVIDTAVLAAGLRSRRGAGHAMLRLVDAGRLRPLVTTALFLEYEDVLKRPEQVLATGLDAGAVHEFLAEFAAFCEPVEIHFLWRPQGRDPADEFVLEAAVNGRADALVTYNARDFVAPAARFGIPALLPGELLMRMQS